MTVNIESFSLVRIFIFAGLTLSSVCTEAQARERAPQVWRDDLRSRLEIYVSMNRLSVDILGGASATRSLENWCRERRLAANPSIVARRIDAAQAPAEPETRQRLRVSDAAQIRYRKVRLYCGERLLSEADNWYVPERLSDEMNASLETTQIPFGKVVAPLAPTRYTVSVKMLYAPLPDARTPGHGFNVRAGRRKPLAIPPALFEHRAVLHTREGLPISEVRETYRKGILPAPPP